MDRAANASWANDHDQSMRNEIQALRRKVEALQSRTHDLEYENAALLNQVEALQSYMEDLESEKKSLLDQVADLENDKQSLENDYDERCETVIRLKDEVRYVEHDNKRFQEEIQALQEKNAEQKKKLELQWPLVLTGVKIRRRFFERAKEHLGYGRASQAILEAGNHIAHRGDLSADEVMIEMGFLRTGDAVPHTKGSNTEMEKVYSSVYWDLYSVAFESECVGLRWPVKHIEYLNIRATVASCTDYKTCNSSAAASNEDWNRVAVLKKRFFSLDTTYRKGKPRDTYIKDFDSCPEVDVIVNEMSAMAAKYVRIDKQGRRCPKA